MAKADPGHILVTPDTNELMRAAQEAQKTGKLPPVHLWNPPFCGNLDMEIRRDGTWIHEGSPIRRAPLVRLFSTILKKEGDDFFLVTPVEKVGIRVEDAPFVAVDFDVDGEDTNQVITFTTNVGDAVAVSSDTPLRVERNTLGEPSPYLMVRNGLEARIDRKSFYRLVDIGVAHNVDGKDWFGVWSSGAFFKFIPLSELSF